MYWSIGSLFIPFIHIYKSLSIVISALHLHKLMKFLTGCTSAKHDLGGVTVSDGGTGSFSASGSNVQSVVFTYQAGRYILLGKMISLVFGFNS
jgi:hypothetical protein